MKRLLFVVIMALALVFSLAACGSSSDKNSGDAMDNQKVIDKLDSVYTDQFVAEQSAIDFFGKDPKIVVDETEDTLLAAVWAVKDGEDKFPVKDEKVDTAFLARMISAYMYLDDDDEKATTKQVTEAELMKTIHTLYYDYSKTTPPTFAKGDMVKKDADGKYTVTLMAEPNIYTSLKSIVITDNKTTEVVLELYSKTDGKDTLYGEQKIEMIKSTKAHDDWAIVKTEYMAK